MSQCTIILGQMWTLRLKVNSSITPIFIVHKHPLLVFSWFRDCFACTVLRSSEFSVERCHEATLNLVKQFKIKKQVLVFCLCTRLAESFALTKRPFLQTIQLPYFSWELLK